MAQRFTGASHAELVDHLRETGVIKSERVLKTMKKIDRGNFVKTNSFVDGPQQLDGFKVTISAPHMHAHALELLSQHMVEGSKVLDVGSGSGYLTACMAIMVGKTGKTVGIDNIPELVEQSKKTLMRNMVTRALMEMDLLKLVVGDGREGYAPDAPYDAIHVGAAAPALPEALVKQLKPGGRLVMPIGPAGQSQSLVQVDKLANGSIIKKDLLNVIYGSLTSR